MLSTAVNTSRGLHEEAQRIQTGQVLFGQCTAYKTRQLARKVMAHFEVNVSDLGIKGTQFALLGCVLRDGPIKSSELARIMELSASTLSRNIRPLIAQGWLAMDQGNDARSRLLSITPEGKRLCKQAGRRWQEAQTQLGHHIGAQQLALLHGMLDSALDSLVQPVSS